MRALIEVLGLSLIGSILALVGGVVFLFSQKWSRVLEKYSVSFAAGVLLTISLVGLLPEAVETVGERAFVITLLTFVAIYLCEHIFFQVHHHDSCSRGNNLKRAIPFVVIGDSIHNFIDGVAIAASYFVSPGLGFITAFSTFLHEVPHEISDFGILLRAGWARRLVLIVNVLSALTTLLGALMVYFFSLNEVLIGFLLAVSAGLFLYLGASDFLPQIEEEEKNPIKAVLPLLAGVAVILLVLLAVPHEHGNGGV